MKPDILKILRIAKNTLFILNVIFCVIAIVLMILRNFYSYDILEKIHTVLFILSYVNIFSLYWVDRKIKLIEEWNKNRTDTNDNDEVFDEFDKE